MPVNGINGSNSVLIAALTGRQRVPARRAAAPPENQPPAPPETAANPITENAQQVNETLRTLTATPAAEQEALLGSPNPSLTVLQATEELNPFAQRELQINATLQTLNYIPPEPVNPLLINELPPAWEAAEIAAELDIAQQAALQVNETLQNLGGEPQAVAPRTLPATPPQPAAALTAEPAPEAAAEPAAPTVAAAVVPAETPATSPATAATTPAATETTTPPNPATMPLAQEPYRSPGAFAVYLVNDPAPPPGPPAPPDTDVPKTTAITPIHAVADSRLRQLLQHGQGGGGGATGTEYPAAPPSLAQAEKSIRYSLNLVNADLSAHGLPLHLVFAKHGESFALDVYDCSFDDSCRLSYDIPVQLDKLTEVLHKLEGESGVIVDTSS